MAKKTMKLRPWTKEDIRMLKTMLREKTKTSVVRAGPGNLHRTISGVSA